MTILGEPIGTWIAIAALIISIYTLVLSRRKQIFDERLVLATQISDIKSKYADGLLLIDNLLADCKKIIEKLTKHKGTEKLIIVLKEIITDLLGFRTRMEKTFDSLGEEQPLTSDPIKLLTFAVYRESVNNSLRLIQQRVTDVVNEADKLERRERIIVKKKK